MVSLVFGAGLLGLLLSMAAPALGAAFVPLVSLSVRYVLFVSGLLEDLPLHALYFNTALSVLWLFYVYALFAVCAIARRGRYRWWIAGALAVTMLLATARFNALQFERGSLYVTALDVGQGESVALLSRRHGVLVDCGSSNSYISAGDVAADYFLSAGIRRLDAVVLTHYHADHANGLALLLARVGVDTLYLPDIAEEDGEKSEVLALAERYGVEVRYVTEETRTAVGEASLTLYPPVGEGGANELGLTIVCSLGTFDTLITGDMDSRTERVLVSSYPLPDIEVLLVGHHGSRYSTSEELLDDRDAGGRRGERRQQQLRASDAGRAAAPDGRGRDRLPDGPAGKYLYHSELRRIMAEKKTADKGYQKFKADLAAGTLGEVYIFCGEESYLREYYLKEVQKKLVPAGFEEFNFHRVAGKGLTMEELTEMTEAMPMMAERTLIVVTDCDLYKLGEEQRTRLLALLDDFPEYCCLIFIYDLVEYKPNKTYKKLYAALSDKAQEVRFEPQDKSDLINWIARRFRATGHDIDARTAEHLMFTCGSLMTGLVPEIEKIGAYAKGRAVTVEDINAVADPVLDAVVFDMTSAVTKGDYDRASELLGQLLKKQEEPIMILGVISLHLLDEYVLLRLKGYTNPGQAAPGFSFTVAPSPSKVAPAARSAESSTSGGIPSTPSLPSLPALRLRFSLPYTSGT